MKDYKKKYEDYLKKMDIQFEYSPIIGKNIEETLLKTLIGTLRTTRLGAVPSAETVEEIRKRIKEKIKKNQPLEISSAWGAVKTVATVEGGIDLAEIITLKQFSAISIMVKKIYSPGIQFNIFLGDSYYTYLYGEDPRVEKYCREMKAITSGKKEINLVRLSELCKESVVSIENQCKENYSALYEYWIESSAVLIEDHPKLVSYRKLHDIGWIGVITQGMREFYLKRMKSLYPEDDYVFWVEKIIHFFAYGLMISQNDLMGRKNPQTSTVDVCLLRVPPPDLPRKLYSNRIKMRVSPESVVKTSAPPWTVAGVLKINDDGELKLSLLDVASYREAKLQKFEYDGMSLEVEID